jgi:hypothetical protein
MHVVKWRKERQSLTERDLLNISGVGLPNSPGRWSRPDSSIPITIDRSNIIKMFDYEGSNCSNRGSRTQGPRTLQLREYLRWGWGGGPCRTLQTLFQAPLPSPSVSVTDISYPWNSVNFIFPWQLIFCVSSASHFLLSPFPSFSISLINPSTRVGGVFSSSSPSFSPFLSSFPSFHCFIYVSAREGLFLIFPWKWNLIAVRNLVCLSVCHVSLVSTSK